VNLSATQHQLLLQRIEACREAVRCYQRDPWAFLPWRSLRHYRRMRRARMALLDARVAAGLRREP